MTTVIPARPQVRRRGIVYGYRTLRPEDDYRTVELGYVGQTRQRLRARDGQHRDDQPWADIIVGGAFVIAEGMWTDNELDAAEQAAICAGVVMDGRVQRPRYNILCNESNPGRILPWVARGQRQARDRAQGRPVWTPPAAVPVRGRVRRPGAVARWWASARWPVLGHLAAWLALSGLVWWFVTADVTVSAGAGAGLLFGGRLVVWFAGLSRRRRRQVVRLAVAVVVAALVVVGWLASR